MPDYSVVDLIRAYQRAGFSGNALRDMAAISLAENPNRQLTAVSPTQDYGPSQVNLPTWGSYFTPDQLFTLVGAAQAAKFIYDQAGGSFSPWTTYQQGLHTANYPVVDAALPDALFGSGGGASITNPLGGFNLPSIRIPSTPNLNPAAAISDAVSKLIAVIKAPIDIMVKILTWLTTSKHWWEMGFILVGFAMIGVGIVLYFHNEAEGAAKIMAVA